MSKRKPAKGNRRRAKAKPLAELSVQSVPSQIVGGFFGPDGDGRHPKKFRSREIISGVSLPPDLEKVADRKANEERRHLQVMLTVPPSDRDGYPWADCIAHWLDDKGEQPEDSWWTKESISGNGWQWIEQAIKDSVMAGFYLAVLRYADDLKNVPEAVAMLERMKKVQPKGAAATKKKAEPRRLAIRRRFKELRRDGHDKGKARLLIEEEYAELPGKKISFRQIERHTKGMS